MALRNLWGLWNGSQLRKVARIDMLPHARAASAGSGHRFAACPRCSLDLGN
jgi:hypothetical protein